LSSRIELNHRRRVMKNLYLFGLIFFAGLMNVGQEAAACTDIIVNTGSEKVSARNMDWPSAGNAKVVINPRGIYRASTDLQPGDTPLNWTSKYGSISIDFINISFVDGINEKGLSAGMLWLDGSRYPPQSADPVLSLDLWAQYYLDNCQTVAEAVALAPTFRVYTVLTFFGLHLILHDASGDSALMEYVDGVLNIYHPMEEPVVTNQPPYPDQLANLLNYQDFGGELPIPGGNDPEARFVRAAWHLRSLPVPTTPDEALGSAFDIIQNAACPPSLISPTWWTVARDHTAKKYYWRTIYNPKIRYVDLNTLDFSPGNPVKVLDMYIDLSGDTSTYFKPEVKHILPGSGDYNGDGTSDIAIFRSLSGLWAVRGITRAYFGGPADLPVPGDYNGDGLTDMGLYRGSCGLWAIRGVTRTYFGSSSIQPLPGDYNGDGTGDIGIFRERDGLWAIKGISRSYFGGSGDLPVPGDYDGDGSLDLGIFRVSTRLWALKNISRIYFAEDYLPVAIIPGDYNGDGTWEPGYFEETNPIDPAYPALWHIRGITRILFGTGSDLPVPGDWAGNSLKTPGIFRADSGLWALKGITRIYYGTSWDTPVTR
jgi:penicillin V acylase-like amidase (Ntn superfamily)